MYKLLFIIIISSQLIYAQKVGVVKSMGKFANASSISINDAGYIFVSDIDNNKIFKLDTLGNEIINIGGYGWGNESFDEPIHLFANILNVFVSDKNNNRVQIFDKDLNYLSSISSNNLDISESIFAYPLASAISNQGEVFLLDSDNIRIIKYSLNGNYLLDIGNNDSGDFLLNEPIDFVLSNNNEIFVIDGNQLLVYDQFGNSIKKLSLPINPNKINIYKNIIYLNDEKNIYKFRINKFSDLSKVNINNEDEMKDLAIFNNKIYILTNNSIHIFTYIN